MQEIGIPKKVINLVKMCLEESLQEFKLATQKSLPSKGVFDKVILATVLFKEDNNQKHPGKREWFTTFNRFFNIWPLYR